MDPRSLPVYQQKDRIVEALSKNQVIVVESSTGSGKTTQLPIILKEAGYAKKGVIGVTQPRRIAAVSVSEFIANQLQSSMPAPVGFKMRFEDNTSADTKIKIMTDGILLQELKADPLLSKYSVIMVDEAHERSLNIDFILGLLKEILRKRKDFTVIISSATINPGVFSEYFNDAPIVSIDTKIFPIIVEHHPLEVPSDPELLIKKITDLISKVEEKDEKGDILIFLTGERLIKECVSAIKDLHFSKQLHILPLYGRLSKEEQERVFDPAPEGKRKIVISTNIAETSVTIDGITIVIDSGLAKINYYNPNTFTASLIEMPISKASCNQRKGRAGRTQPGICYRLYSEEDYENRPDFTTEEIYRTDLSEVVLRMAELGIRDFIGFDFISQPEKRDIHGAREILDLLDALEDDNSLTKIGSFMCEFPLLPRLARMIVESVYRYPDVLEETVTAAAFLSTNTPFLLPQGEEMAARKAHHAFRDKHGDFVSYLNLLDAYKKARNKERFCERNYLDPKTMSEIRNIKEQLLEILSEKQIPIQSNGDVADYLCSVARGLIQFVCVRTKKYSYSSLTASQIQIHPGSVMFKEVPDFIVAGEIVRTSKTYARSVSPLQKNWLSRISPKLSKRLFSVSKKSQGKSGKDTSWEIQVSGFQFKLKPFRGKKKIAILPWNDLVAALADASPDDFMPYRKIKGLVRYKGFEIFSGERLGKIVDVLPYLDRDPKILHSWPKGKSYSADNLTDEFFEYIKKLMSFVPLKKSKRNLGFLTLSSDGTNRFWFKSVRKSGQAISLSLANMEVLADALPADFSEEKMEIINRTYRKLSEMVEL
ncbi:MAG: helicase-related protein [Spirochaetia bacterium]